MTAEIEKTLDQLLNESRKREDEERRRNVIEAYHKISGVPARFKGCTLENFEPRTDSINAAHAFMRTYLAEFSQHAKAGRCAILLGDAGVGKTHLVCAMVNALCSHGRRARYVRFGDAIKRIRASWRSRDGEESELDVLNDYHRQDLLVIDEIGVQYGSEGEQNHAFDIIDRRYADMKPTIIVTNATNEGLMSYLGPRVVDRLLDNDGRMLRLQGKSNRK